MPSRRVIKVISQKDSFIHNFKKGMAVVCLRPLNMIKNPEQKLVFVSSQKLLQTLQLKNREKMGCGTSSDSVDNVTIPGKDLYQRKQLIGVGHHGRVYRCLYNLDGKEYAIKVVSQLQDQCGNLLSQQEYTVMMQTLKEIKSSSLAELIYAQLAESELSVVMELSREGTLKKYIAKNGKLTQQSASKITFQILQGLLFLQKQNFSHKDLKPQNILIFQNQTTKLTDFMIAQIYDGRLNQKEKINKKMKEQRFYRGDSLPYMAPEVISGEGWNNKADTWSLGCVLIEMLTGKVPWSDISTTFEEVFKTIKKSAYPSLPSDLSKQCEDFLRCCLSVNESKRSSLKTLLKHPFISQHLKESEIFFQVSNSKSQLEISRLKLQQNDKANRVPSRNSRNQSLQKMEQTLKTPSIAQKKYGNENHQYYTGSSNRKISKKQNLENDYSSHTSKSIKKIGGSNEYATVSKEEILPQINEDEQETNMVMLNNKKTKMKSPPPSKNLHLQTEPIQEITSHRYERNSATLDQNLSQSLQKGMSKKMGTQPNLLSSDVSINKDYFKRPLKLLKKKLNDSKKRGHTNQSSNFSSSFNQNQSSVVELSNVYKDEKVKNNQKIRSNTEDSRDEFVIDTQVARAERDRYINEQLVLKRQREQEKVKWEEQLKKEAQLLKRQLSHRYAYPYPNIPQ